MSTPVENTFNFDFGIAVVDRIGADAFLSLSSENAVQNKVVTAALDAKQNKGDYVLKEELEKRLGAVEESIEDILYEPITIKSFSVSPSTSEIGSTVDEILLSWGLDRDAFEIAVDGEMQPTSREGDLILTEQCITSNTTWTLTATDERGATAEKTASLTFLNGVYYGVKAAPGEYDSAFILGLTKNLRSSKLTSISVNAGDGQYIYYCLPKRFGTCSFTVGGFSGGFSLVETIQFENASGYTEDYYIYKSDNAGLGSTKVTIA